MKDDLCESMSVATARALLLAGRFDEPLSPEARERIAARLGLRPLLGGAQALRVEGPTVPPSNLAESAWGRSLWRWKAGALLSLVGAGAALAVTTGLRHGAAESLASQPGGFGQPTSQASSDETASAVGANSLDSASPPATGTTQSIDSLPDAPASPHRSPLHRSQEVPSFGFVSRPGAAYTQQWTQELLQLDHARAASARGAPAEALRELDAYVAAFPSGILRSEGAVVRIEALAALGRAVEARDLAQTFLRSDGASPYAARVRAATRGVSP